MSGRVFVIQRPVYKDPETREWRDKYDLSPAAHFGRLVEVLPVGNIPVDAGVTIRKMEAILGDFDEGDHIMLVGDPIATAIAVLVITRRHGSFSVLKWDRKAGSYRSVRVGL